MSISIDNRSEDPCSCGGSCSRSRSRSRSDSWKEARGGVAAWSRGLSIGSSSSSAGKNWRSEEFAHPIGLKPAFFPFAGVGAANCWGPSAPGWWKVRGTGGGSISVPRLSFGFGSSIGRLLARSTFGLVLCSRPRRAFFGERSHGAEFLDIDNVMSMSRTFVAVGRRWSVRGRSPPPELRLEVELALLDEAEYAGDGLLRRGRPLSRFC